MVRHLQLGPNQLKQRAQESLGLPPPKSKDETKFKGEPNGPVGVAPLAAASTALARRPCFESIRGKPYGQATALDQAFVVLRPVRDPVESLVAGMDFRT